MNRKKFRDILLLGALLIGIYFLCERSGLLLGFAHSVWLILSPFILGGAFAFILNVPMRFLEKHVLCFMDRTKWSRRIKRPTAMLLVVALVFLLIYLILSLVLPEVFKTIVTIINAIPAAIGRLDALLSPHGISVSEYINATFTMPSAGELNAKIGDMMNLVLKGAAFSGTVIGTVYQNVLGGFFTLMFVFYFLSAKEKLAAQIKRVMAAYLKPNVTNEVLRVAGLSQRTFSSFITGQCLEAVILGGLFFLALTIFRMPYVVLISIFIAVTALIPVIGAWIGCIIGALLILVSNPMQALGFVALFLVVQQLEGNLIYPHVMGNAIGLPSIWVLFAVVLGEGLFGIVGMLLFIPLTSVCYTLLREQVNERLKKKQTEIPTAEG